MPAITKEQNIRHPVYKLYWASVQGGVFNPYRISGVKYSLVPISRKSSIRPVEFAPVALEAIETEFHFLG